MAEQIDGAIILDAGINTNDFERDSEKLRQSAERLSRSVEQVGKKLQTDVSNYGKALVSASKQMEQSAEAVQRAFGGSDLKGVSREARDLDAALVKTQKELDSVNAKLKDYYAEVQRIKASTDAMLSNAATEEQTVNTLELEKTELEQLAQKYSDLLNLQKQLEAESRRASERRAKIGDLTGLSDWTDSVSKMETAFNRYQERIDRMTALGANAKQWKSLEYDIGKAAEKIAEYRAQIERLKESGAIGDGAYAQLTGALDQLGAKAAAAQNAVNSALSSAFDNAAQSADGAEESLKGVDRELNRKGPDARGAAQGVMTLGETFKDLGELVLRAGASLAKIAGAAVLSGLRTIGAAAGEAAENLTKMTAHAVVSGVKRLGAWLTNAARSMLIFQRASQKNNGVLKRGFMTILRYGLGIRSLYFLFNKIRKAIKEGFENLAKYSDDVNKSISQVISSFSRFKNQFAASFSPIVNVAAPALAKFIDLLSEATFRAGELFAALSGKKAVIKAKEVEEDYAESLKNEKEQKAELREETRAAIAKQSEYAAMTGESAESLDEETEAAKKLKRQLAKFDDLEILKIEKEDEDKSKDLFETVPIDFEMIDLAGKIKEMWRDLDLSGLGEILGGKIEVALGDIPWPDIKKAASDLGKRLATFLNGLINAPELGANLGKAIAEAINTAFAFVDGFVWSFDWKGLGNAIMDTVEAVCDNLDWQLINHALQGLAIGLADLLNTIFSRVEVWEKVGITIGNGINAAVNAGITFLERFDFNQAARAIVTGLNAAIAEVVWEDIGLLLADAFGGALQFIRTAVLEFHWVDLGKSFAEGLNEFVRVMLDKILHFEWEQIGTGIADGVNAAVSGIGWNSFGTLVGRLIGGALKTAASFIRELDFEEIKKSIEEFFSSALRRIDYYDLITVWGVAALIAAVKRIIAAHPVLALLTTGILALGPKLGGVIHKMVETIPWADVGKKLGNGLISALNRLTDALNSVNWHEIGEKVTEMLLNVDWSGVFDALVNALGAFLKAGLDFLRGMFAPLNELVNEYFQKQAESMGGNIILGVLAGIVKALLGIVVWVAKHIFLPIWKAICYVFGIHSPSTEMEPIGENIALGLLNAMSLTLGERCGIL